MLRFYDGSKVRRNASDHLTVTANGMIYIGALLREQLPEDTVYVQLGVDDQKHTLHIAPCGEETPGRVALVRKPNSRNSCRIHCRLALAWCGVCPKDKLIAPGQFVEGQIVASLPASMFQSDVQPSAKTTKPKAETPKKETPKAAGNQPKETREAAVEARCITCPFYKAVLGNRLFATCGNTNCSKYGKSVRADEVHACHPARKAASAAQAAPPRKHYGSRPRGICPDCAGNFAVSGKGLSRHDIHGVVYQGGSGDREHPCPGSNKEPSKLVRE